jgi:hypothetical protein
MTTAANLFKPTAKRPTTIHPDSSTRSRIVTHAGLAWRIAIVNGIACEHQRDRLKERQQRICVAPVSAFIVVSITALPASALVLTGEVGGDGLSASRTPDARTFVRGGWEGRPTRDLDHRRR